LRGGTLHSLVKDSMIDTIIVAFANAANPLLIMVSEILLSRGQ